MILNGINHKVDKLILRIIGKNQINPAALEVLRNLFYLFIALLLLVVLLVFLYPSIQRYSEAEKSNKLGKKYEEENFFAPTPFLIPSVSSVNSEGDKITQESILTMDSLIKELVLTDDRLFYSVELKKNTRLKLINMTRSDIGLVTSDETYISLMPGEVEYISFNDVGKFRMKDIKHDRLGNGFVIEVKVLE